MSYYKKKNVAVAMSDSCFISKKRYKFTKDTFKQGDKMIYFKKIRFETICF